MGQTSLYSLSACEVISDNHNKNFDEDVESNDYSNIHSSKKQKDYDSDGFEVVSSGVKSKQV